MFGGFFNKAKDSNTGKYKRPYYSLRNVNADKVLDIEKQGKNPGSATIYKPWGGDNQVFSFIDQGGQWLIKSKAKNQQGQELFLTVDSDKDGALVCLRPKSGQPNQLFKISEDEGHKTHLIYTFCGKVLEVLEQKKDEGARVSQYSVKPDKDKRKHQLWNFCDPKDVTSSSSHND